MEFIRSWVGQLAAVSMIISAVSVICPKNSARRAVMLCGSLLMTAVLILPVKSFDFSAIKEYERQYKAKAERLFESLSVENESIKEEIIEDRTSAYILQRTEALGVSCSVRINCEGGVPHTAYVNIKNDNDKSRISKLLETECGIPEERQIFKTEVAP